MHRPPGSRAESKPGRPASSCVFSLANSTRHGSCSEHGYRGIDHSNEKYIPLLDPEGTAALNNLKRHFGGSPLTQIRKKVAFHYSDDDNSHGAEFFRRWPIRSR